MKQFYLTFLFISGIFFTCAAQEFSYGIGLKGGANYIMGGEVRGSNSNSTYWDGTVQGEGAFGYHGGIFFELGYGKFFIRPEAVYSSLKQEFAIPKRNENTTYTVETFTIPVLLGYNIYGPVDIYAGPVYSRVLNANIENVQNNNMVLVTQNTPINAQAGIKVEFGRFGLDVRYEHSLSTAESQLIDFDNRLFGDRIGGANRAWIEDGRLNQLIVSATFKLFGTGLNEGRRRRGSCY